MPKQARENIPLESAITAQIQRWLKSQACWWGFKVLGGAQQKRGVPDIVGTWNGSFIAFEVKRPVVGRVSPLQEHVIEEIQKAGGHAFVVRSVEDVKRAIMRIDPHMLAARVFDRGGDV